MMVFDHIVPLLICLSEFILMHSYPFYPRQILALFLFGFIYMIVNMTVTLTGKPIYPRMTWDSPIGFILPVSCLFIAMLLQWVLTCINNCKLAKLDIHPIKPEINKEKDIEL